MVWLRRMKVQKEVGARGIDDANVMADNYEVYAHWHPETRRRRKESTVNKILAAAPVEGGRRPKRTSCESFVEKKACWPIH